MIFLTPDLDPASKDVLTRLDELRARLRLYLREPTRWIGSLRRNILARSLRGSNTIEGYNVTVDDAIAAVDGEAPLDADEATWLEILGYRQAMTYVLQLARDPSFRHSADHIKGLHYMLLSHDLPHSPGQWRPGYIAVKVESTGQIVYEGPDAAAVPELMEAFVRSLNEESDAHPIIRAAMAHLNLTMIHPFRDGNGRMARCVQTLVLGRDGILAPEFSSIEEYLGKNTQDYYDVLAAVGGGSWHPKNDTAPWLRFCLTAHFRQATTLLFRVERIKRLWDALETHINERDLPSRAIFALSDAALGYRVRNPLYRKAAEITTNLASRDLRQMVRAGFLIPKGEKKGRYYIASDWVRDIALVSDRQKKLIADPFEQLSLGR